LASPRPDAADSRPAGSPGRAGEVGARRAEAIGSRLPPLLVAAERVAATIAQGVHGRRRVGQGDSFWQFRPYVEGDPIEQIDWWQSANSGRDAPEGWMVRETEWEAAQTVHLWRDGSPSMRWRSRAAAVEKRDRASLLLLALASLLLRGGERVALMQDGGVPRWGVPSGGVPSGGVPSGGMQGGSAPGESIPGESMPGESIPGGSMRAGPRPIAGRFGLDRVAAELGDADDGGGLPPDLPLPRHASVVLFGDFLSPLEEIHAFIGRLAAVPVTGYLMQVLDPAEAVLPYEGRIRFRGLERDGDTLIPRVENVRDAYTRRLKAQQEGLATMCAAAGFGFGVHRTDHPPETALLMLYTALGSR
jgi:uncharacterized protein (DUF58 family)